MGRLSNLSRETSWASLYWSRLGETSSLGRENQSSPLFSRAFTLNRFKNGTKSSHPSSYNKPNISKRQNRGTINITQKKRADPSFPYLENKLVERSDTHIVSKTVPRMVNKLERTVKQRKGTGYYQILTVNNEHRPWKEGTWAEDWLTWSRSWCELARRRPRANPSRAFCEKEVRWRLIFLKEWKWKR